MPSGIGRPIFQRMNEFYGMTMNDMPVEKIAQRFGKTYWYYYFFTK